MISFDNNILHIHNISAIELARQYATPLYVYDADTIKRSCKAYSSLIAPYPIALRYAVKANPTPAIVKIIHQAGFGFDVVSGGELDRVVRIGADVQQLVYSGVGKSTDELQEAVNIGIGCINVESIDEVKRLIDITEKVQKPVSLAIRINPQVSVDTHPYIATALATSKFGVFASDLPAILALLQESCYCRLIGLACHLGSMIEDVEPLIEACGQLLELRKMHPECTAIDHISIGGGLAVRYKDEVERSPQQLIDGITVRFGDQFLDHGLTLMLEPGRSIVACAGILLTKVEYVKHNQQRNFLVVDAAMNDLPRPSLYNAWHRVMPACQRTENERMYEIVGPVCETSDCLAHERQIAAKQGDILAFCTAGAYTASMASNYNCRPRAASVLIENGQHRLITRRESREDLRRNEL